MNKQVSRLICGLNYHNCLNWVPDKLAVKLLYEAASGRKINVEKPAGFNEKLQWLKLYDRKPQYTMMSDKYRVREFIKERIGEEYLIPMLGVWENPDNIDFDSLPNEFILKCNHDSGGVVVCRDKNRFDKEKAKATLKKCLSRSGYTYGREWPYKDIKPCVVAEQLMKDSIAERFENADGLIDYKFYCFNGEPKFLYIAFANMKDGKKNDLLDYFTLDFEKAPFYRTNHESIPFEIPQPENYEKMIELARVLSKDIPFVRADFYNLDGKIYFSEMTFFPGGGFSPFEPPEWEKEIGSWIDIEKINKTR